MRYSEQQKKRCMERIREICNELPSFAVPYINHVATRRDTTFRTGQAYAYDLLVFFRYLEEEKKISTESVTPADLAAMKPLDIEMYLSHLTSYETEEDRAYNAELRRAKEENRAKKPGERNQSLDRKPFKSHHMSASARARNLAAVRGLYKHLNKNGFIDVNPAALAETPRPTPHDVIALTGDQANEVLRKAVHTEISRARKQFAARQQLRDTAILTLLLYTGMRVSECAGIDLDHFDWANSGVQILRKGGRYETVFFNEQTKKALLDYIDNERLDPLYDTQALFVSRRRERMSTQAIENVVKKYAGGVSLHKITPHKLRSTYATALYHATNDAYEVKDALGHSTLSVVQKYISEAERHRKAASAHIDYGSSSGNE